MNCQLLDSNLHCLSHQVDWRHCNEDPPNMCESGVEQRAAVCLQNRLCLLTLLGNMAGPWVAVIRHETAGGKQTQPQTRKQLSAKGPSLHLSWGNGHTMVVLSRWKSSWHTVETDMCNCIHLCERWEICKYRCKQCHFFLCEYSYVFFVLY